MKRVGSFKVAVIFGVLALGTITLAFQNCSQAPEISNSSLNSNSNSGVSDPNKLAVLPTDVLLSAGGTQVFKISGGKTPYSWSVSPVGCGSFDTSTKTYTAPAASGICTFSVTDATGTQVSSLVSVSESSISATYTPNPAAASATIEISPSGGTPGYNYSLISGSGQLSGFVYRAPAFSETAIVRITDSAGKSIDLSIAIGGGGGGTGGTQQIFRNFFAGASDFLHTKNAGEGASSGYANQPGATIKLFTTGGTNRIEILRCYRQVHFVAVGSTCNGATNEGSLGFVERSQANGATKQLFLCNFSSSFLTLNSGECANAGVAAQAIGFTP